MITCYIGLGSNLNDPRHQLDSALASLGQLADCQFHDCSPYYGSKAIGPGLQPHYVNAAARLDTRLSAHQLLHALQVIEQQHGRQRSLRWQARTLDLDLLLYGDQKFDDDELTVPHPRISGRNFVIYPLFDLAPDLCIPGAGTIADLRTGVTTEGIWRLSTSLTPQTTL